MVTFQERYPRLGDRVYRAPSAIHGFGLFARVAIPAGSYIGSYEGPRARRDGVYVLWVYEAIDRDPVGRSGRNLLRWLNHRDDGNAEFDGFDLYARRPIAAGEEITFDYSGGEAVAALERAEVC
jgi:SET domain-containing protein